jgi:hypothetical protein
MNRIEREYERRVEGRRRRGVCSLDLFPDPPPAPQPDPNIGQAAAANAEVAREALAFQKQMYEESKPRQQRLDDIVDQVVRQQLGIQEKQAGQADDYINYMKSTFRPVEQRLAQEAMDFDTEARREELAGRAAADVRQAFGAERERIAREQQAYGIDPSSGRAAGVARKLGIAEAGATAGAMNAARTAARTEGRAFKFDVSGLGRGLPGAGATASSVALQAGNAATGNAALPGQNARADAGLMQEGFRTGIAGHSAAGNIYTNLYDAQLRGWGAQQQADAAASAGLWGGLGTLGGAAIYRWGLPAAFTSARAAKRRQGRVIEGEVVKKVKDMPVDRWRYKKSASSDQATHVGPYAEDFKRRFGVGDGKTISVIDAIGVTLAAVKGVAKKVDRLEAKVAHFAKKGVGHG